MGAPFSSTGPLPLCLCQGSLLQKNLSGCGGPLGGGSTSLCLYSYHLLARFVVLSLLRPFPMSSCHVKFRFYLLRHFNLKSPAVDTSFCRGSCSWFEVGADPFFTTNPFSFLLQSSGFPAPLPSREASRGKLAPVRLCEVFLTAILLNLVLNQMLVNGKISSLLVILSRT